MPCFLAHLSLWLIYELIVYTCSIRRRRPQFQAPFRLLNRLANQSQILRGASLSRAKGSLFTASGSHDQDGRQAHMW